MDITSEQTPLLLPSEVSNSNEPSTVETEQLQNEPRYLFHLSLALIFLLQAGLAIPAAPTTSILEKLICERLDYEEDCKGEAVQAELAMLKGMATFFLLLPGCFLVVPFAMLTERVGAQRVLILSIIGIWLAEAWYTLVCWQGQTWPLELLWLSPIFYLLGGGSTVFVSLLYAFVADVSPPHLRTARFFQLEASAHLGNILSYLASSMLMDKNPWLPVILGLGLIALTGCLLIITLSIAPAKNIIKSDQPNERNSARGDEEEQDLDDQGPLSLTRVRKTLSAIKSVLTSHKPVVALLFGYFLQMLGICVSRIELIYISKRLGWTIAQAAYFISLDSAVRLAVLLLLPGITALLLLKFSFSNLEKDIWLARLSIIFSFVGCAGLALSPTPMLMVISTIIYGFGAGYGSSIRGVVTSVISSQHRALLYSIMSMLDVIGTLIGTPLWPAIYKKSLKIGGLWIGLPFGIASIMLAAVSLTIEISYFTGSV